jgi:ACR3 family arsenite transporter
MNAGVEPGRLFPQLPETFRGMESGQESQFNIPIALLIWRMIYPMILKVDFSSLIGVRNEPRGLFITLVVNWLTRLFSMAVIALEFFKHLFLPFPRHNNRASA